MSLPFIDRPLRWKSNAPEVAALLADLPANVLKGHARAHTVQLFLAFDGSAANRDAIHALSGELTTAGQQLREAEAHRLSGRDAGTVRCFYLTYTGYEALGVAQKAPGGKAFRKGAAALEKVLLRDQGAWEPYLRGPIHALRTL